MYIYIHVYIYIYIYIRILSFKQYLCIYVYIYMCVNVAVTWMLIISELYVICTCTYRTSHTVTPNQCISGRSSSPSTALHRRAHSSCDHYHTLSLVQHVCMSSGVTLHCNRFLSLSHVLHQLIVYASRCHVPCCVYTCVWQ